MALSQQHRRLRELLDGIRIAMLTTRHGNELRSRPMATIDMDPDGILWFFTEAGSGKIDEIEAAPEVVLCYSRPDADRYVAVQGHAETVRDEERQRLLWTPMMAAWFPEGPADPNVRLLRVDITSAEYWDSPGGKVQSLIGMAAAVLTGRRADPGEHGTLNVAEEPFR